MLEAILKRVAFLYLGLIDTISQHFLNYFNFSDLLIAEFCIKKTKRG